MDHSIREKSPAEIEADNIKADLAHNAWKTSGGPHRDNDARALALQHRYQPLNGDYPS